MSSDYKEQKPTMLVPMGVQELLRVAAVGVLVGVVTWGLAWVLDVYVFKSIVCRGDGPAQCASSFEYASAIASILGAAVGLFGLIKLQVFRSLLVVLAATISLWQVEVVLHTWSWQGAVIVSLLLFAGAYSLFVWLARIRSFLMAVIVTVVLVVAVRLALNS